MSTQTVSESDRPTYPYDHHGRAWSDLSAEPMPARDAFVAYLDSRHAKAFGMLSEHWIARELARFAEVLAERGRRPSPWQVMLLADAMAFTVEPSPTPGQDAEPATARTDEGAA